MIKIYIFIACTLSLIICQDSVRYIIDTEESIVFWVGRKITGEHYGTINIKDGYIDISDNKVINGEFFIDMESIKVLDMSSEYNKKLESHLKSSDFFTVDQFPTASFKIKGMYDFFMIDNIGFKGDLTIKNTTIETLIAASISINDSTAESIGVINIDRTLFGITYGSGSFFDDIADKAIDDSFTLKFKLVSKIDD